MSKSKKDDRSEIKKRIKAERKFVREMERIDSIKAKKSKKIAVLSEKIYEAEKNNNQTLANKLLKERKEISSNFYNFDES